MCHFRTAEDQKSLEASISQMFLLLFLIVLDHAFSLVIVFPLMLGGEPSQDLRIIANLALGRKFYLFSNEATPEFDHLVGTA